MLRYGYLSIAVAFFASYRWGPEPYRSEKTSRDHLRQTEL